MPDQFQVFTAPDGGYSFRLLDSSGNTWATSGTYPTKQDVAAAISLVREIAGTGLICDRTKAHNGEPVPTRIRPTKSDGIHNGSPSFPSPATQSRLGNHRRAPANA